jgi:hypothetical protein
MCCAACRLAGNGQIEPTGTGKFHPILPPCLRGGRRQITLNAESRERTSENIPARGLPPEWLARQPRDRASGHRWLLLSGIACTVAWPQDRVHRVQESRLSAYFPDDILSSIISFRSTDVPDFITKRAR